jgi:hypothetical protein
MIPGKSRSTLGSQSDTPEIGQAYKNTAGIAAIVCVATKNPKPSNNFHILRKQINKLQSVHTMKESTTVEKQATAHRPINVALCG